MHKQGTPYKDVSMLQNCLSKSRLQYKPSKAQIICTFNYTENNIHLHQRHSTKPSQLPASVGNSVVHTSL